jgi:hypothetical protein
MGSLGFSLDGAPNMSNRRGQAINLSADEPGQTSVNLTQYDASVGHTYGISINQTTRSGTNDFHGALRYQRYDLREVTNRYDYAVNNADHIFFTWHRAHDGLHNTTFLANNFMAYHQDK